MSDISTAINGVWSVGLVLSGETRKRTLPSISVECMETNLTIGRTVIVSCREFERRKIGITVIVSCRE